MAGDFFVDSTPVSIFDPKAVAKTLSPLAKAREQEELRLAKIRTQREQLALDQEQDIVGRQKKKQESKSSRYTRMTQTRNRAAALDILNNIYGGDATLNAFLTAIKHTR